MIILMVYYRPGQAQQIASKADGEHPQGSLANDYAEKATIPLRTRHWIEAKVIVEVQARGSGRKAASSPAYAYECSKILQVNLWKRP